MATRMQHPEHGWTHAYDEGEVARLEKLGWSVEKPPVVEPPQKKKPGPKPKAK
jgi:hypothetical protein